MNVLTSISLIAGLFYLIYKAFGKSSFSFSEQSEPNENSDNYDFYIDDITHQLNNVNDVMSRVQTLEALITDIEICAPEEHIKNFTLKWADKRGVYQKYDFIVDGNNINTECIIDMAYAERNKLRTILKKEIRTLDECSNTNSNENNSDSGRGGMPCERY